jgi:hypothetical protein
VSQPRGSKAVHEAHRRAEPVRRANGREASRNDTNECPCGELVAYPGARYCVGCEEAEGQS